MPARLAARGTHVLLPCPRLLQDELAAASALHSPLAEVMVLPSPGCSQAGIKQRGFHSHRPAEIHSLAQG